MDDVHRVVNIDQTPIGRNSRSNPATYIGFYDAIRDLFTGAPLSVQRDYKPGRFSFNVKGGRCEECQGEGVITTQLYFMPDVEVTCGACKGARFNSETLEVTLHGKTIDDILNMSVEEGLTFFAAEPAIGKKIEVLNDLGLGYLTLGQSATTLSGGEAQRVKIAAELSKLQRGKHTLYILDEPTTGLHLADVERLLESLNRLVDAGHTVLLIEHHLDVIKTADYVIDLGPEGGHAGGEVLVTGTPEDVAACAKSYTGGFLKEVLRRTPVVERRVRPVEQQEEATKTPSTKKAAPRPRKELVKAGDRKPAGNPSRAATAPPSLPPQTFKAVITLAGTRAIIKVPFDPNAVWGNRTNHYATGTIDGHRYRGVMEPAGAGYFLPLGPAWRRDNGLDAGASVEVVLYPDGLQVGDLSPDVSQALESEPGARARFESLATGYRRNMIRWIESAKRPETRATRIKRVIRFLNTTQAAQ
jgi:ABC-type multidrug transport system ATPase subunit